MERLGLVLPQATDSIVEFAVKTGKPFAVVPCCVFPRLFSYRRLPRSGSGAPGSPRPAQTADHAVHGQYSNGKSPCREVLMEGNIVIGAGSSHSETALGEGMRMEGMQHLGVRRELPGEGVESHAQLLMYLRHMGGPSARDACLPFEGMNQVVYRLPNSV